MGRLSWIIPVGRRCDHERPNCEKAEGGSLQKRRVRLEVRAI